MLPTRCLKGCCFSLLIFQGENADSLKGQHSKLVFYFDLELNSARVNDYLGKM